MDRAGADRVDADAARRIFDTRAFGHSEHGVLGESGRLPRIGAVIKIRIGRGKALIAKIVAHPRLRGEPLEAAELQLAFLEFDD